MRNEGRKTGKRAGSEGRNAGILGAVKWRRAFTIVK